MLLKIKQTAYITPKNPLDLKVKRHYIGTGAAFATPIFMKNISIMADKLLGIWYNIWATYCCVYGLCGNTCILSTCTTFA